MCKDGEMARRSVSEAISCVVIGVEFAVQVGRENCMNCSTVDMPCFSVVEIRFWMHVDQWNKEHPQRCPHEDDHAKPCEVNANQLHWE